MLGMKELGTVELPQGLVGEMIAANQRVFLAIGGGQVLGGGSAAGEGRYALWTVTDVTPPWPNLAAQGQVRLVPVSPEVSEAVQDTLERFSAAGEQRAQTEEYKRQGALEAIQVMMTTAVTTGAAIARQRPPGS